MSQLWRSEDGVLFISNSKDLIDFSQLQDFLDQQRRWKGVNEAIWDEVVAASTSILGVYEIQKESTYLKQVGFARTVSDHSRFTWLGDFFILPSHRGIGLGKALLKVLLTSATFQARRQVVDVQGSIELQNLIQRYGEFSLSTAPDPMNAATMYKLVPTRLVNPQLEIESHYPDLNKERVYHPTSVNYFVSTSRDLLQLDVVHGFLQNAYWSRGIIPAVVEREMEQSDCIGLFYEPTREAQNKVKPEQVGFARWITDRSTFAYLSDVFVVEQHAGKGLGKWLIRQAQEMPAIKRKLPGVRSEATEQEIFPRLLMLRTSTAQDLYYRHAGFREIHEGEDQPVKFMVRSTSILSR